MGAAEGAVPAAAGGAAAAVAAGAEALYSAVSLQTQLARIAAQFGDREIPLERIEFTRRKMLERARADVEGLGRRIVEAGSGAPGRIDPAPGGTLTLATHEPAFDPQGIGKVGRAYTREEMNQTLIHERRHERRIKLKFERSRYEEYISVQDEFLYQHGRRPNLRERLAIINDVVNEFYDWYEEDVRLEAVRRRLADTFSR